MPSVRLPLRAKGLKRNQLFRLEQTPRAANPGIGNSGCPMSGCRWSAQLRQVKFWLNGLGLHIHVGIGRRGVINGLALIIWSRVALIIWRDGGTDDRHLA